ncbi:MAG: 2-phosphosulfolactate phosphatase [Bacteroidales bacterium]|jgi:2-phosphosulfolactate phosphatase|nr:2-phosphosulfolactate phosphatase [Bacteroidales bacterium]
MNNIEVCFTPALFEYTLTEQPFSVVVIDILRATTSICTAFQNDVKEIIPVATTEEAISYKNKGFLIAAERNGIKLDFADFGNSPDNFSSELVRGRSIVYSTTNGTHTIKKISTGSPVVIASFINISAAANFIAKQNKNTVIVCAGWKNKFNLEDSIFAGALTERLIKLNFNIMCDSAHAALDLWTVAKKDVIKYIQKAMHRERLKKLKLDSILDYCFTEDLTDAVPVYDGLKITNATIK